MTKSLKDDVENMVITTERSGLTFNIVKLPVFIGKDEKAHCCEARRVDGEDEALEIIRGLIDAGNEVYVFPSLWSDPPSLIWGSIFDEDMKLVYSDFMYLRIAHHPVGVE